MFTTDKINKLYLSTIFAMLTYLGFTADNSKIYLEKFFPSLQFPNAFRISCILFIIWITFLWLIFQFLVLYFRQKSNLSYYIFSNQIPKWLWRVKPNISWYNQNSCLAHTTSHPHRLTLVGAVSFQGFNNWPRPIEVKTAELKSLITGSIIEGKIEGVPANECIIQPHMPFTINFIFPNHDGFKAENTIFGISIDEFKQKYSEMLISIATQRKKYSFRLCKDFTLQWSESIKCFLNPPDPALEPKQIERKKL